MKAGSSLTTDKNGVKTSEMRYCEASLWDKPGGETRYSWTSALATTPAYMLSSYTFTGQYSYMDDLSTPTTEGFGLMFYNARWYDPYLNHFTQPDSIIPQNQGVQAWDRYAFVNNNPVRYTDPTGHAAWNDNEGFSEESCASGDLVCQLDAGGYEPKSSEEIDQDWEDIADIVTPAIASGSKEEVSFTFGFNAGGVWGGTLITTKYGDAEFFYEHGLAVTEGPVFAITETSGLAFGLDERDALSYQGDATSGALSIEVIPAVSGTVGGWKSDQGGAWGVDAGESFGVSLPVTINGAHTNAEPRGHFTISGPLLIVCRLLSGCGR